MAKRFLVAVVIIALLAQLTLATLSLVASASSAPIRVIVNGRALTLDVPPVIRDGRTLVPLRAIFEALGATVGWEEATQTITGQRSGKTIVLRVGNTRARVGDAEVTLVVPPAVVNGRTMVPVRFIAESLGAVVNWNEANRAVEVVTETGATPPPPATAAGIVIASVDLRAEAVVLRNSGTAAVDISGWTLVSEVGNQRFVFPRGIVIQAGATLTIVSGPGAKAGAGALFWTDAHIWNNNGDTAILLNANNVEVSRR